MDALLKWFLIVCTLALVLYKYGTRNFGYWKKKGVLQLRAYPFLGTDLFGLFKRKDVLDICNELYIPFKERRFGGLYMRQKPFLAITDPELIKQVLVKDADCFYNRYEWAGNSDPIMSKNLINLKDENWKKMRTVLSTVFTSAKMKDMFGFMDKCAKQAVDHVQQEVSDHAGHKTTAALEKDMKEFYSRYGTDVIGSTAFGFEVNSFKNPDNDFYKSGTVITNAFKGFQAIRFFLIMTFPKLSQKLGLTFFGNKYNKYFVTLVEDTIREREEKNIVRKDVIHVLMEARKGKGVDENGEPIKGKLPDLTDLDIAGQALVFFFGGFETMATVLGFVSYELALNPDVQEKLQQEIDEVIERENGITYDGVIHQMQYLDMVIRETLRKWPPGAMTDREVTKPYVIPKTETTPEVVLNRGDHVLIPIAALHRDPNHFPNPKKFDPERFRNEKATIKPFTYLPFGEGLRHCVAMRYALMETKVILVHMLRKFSFVPGKKTPIPMKLKKMGLFVTQPENGFCLGVAPRN